MKYLILDNEAGCMFKSNSITPEIENKVKEGYYQIVDLVTLETINSNKNGLFRTIINEY